MRTVLIVEDEPAMLRGLEDNFKAKGYYVLTAMDGRQGLDTALKEKPDLILLDIMLPEINGYEVCSRIREKGLEMPIIMLTAKDQESDIVLGLNLGADDYVTKPFSHRELAARIRAVLRRGQDVELLPDVIEDGGVRMDVERHEVSVGGRPVKLALKEFELLEMLLRNSGRVMTRGQLIDRVWGSDYVGDTKTLDVHIKRLRGKLEEDPARPKLLLTVRGLGYKFDAGGR